MILNPENICACGNYKGKRYDGCFECRDVVPKKRTGRPEKYSDEQILAALDAGWHTLDQLLMVLGVKSKSNLMIRLRRLQEKKLVHITERKRRDGYTIRRSDG